jgi:hypothetical protein
MKSANPRPKVADIRRVPSCHFSGVLGARNNRVVQRVLARLLLLVTVVVPIKGRTEDLSSQNLNAAMPHCGPQSDGHVYCKFGALYECQLIGQNSLDRRTGWRWKADILRTCAEPGPINTDNRRYSLSPEVVCGPRRPDDDDQQGDRGDAGRAGERRHDRTMYIRPGDCPQLNH